MLEGRCGIITLERNCLPSEARRLIAKQWKVKTADMPEKVKNKIKNMKVNEGNAIPLTNKKGPSDKKKAEKKVEKYKTDIDISLLKKFQKKNPKKNIIKFLTFIRTRTGFLSEIKNTTGPQWQEIIKNLNEVNTKKSKENRKKAKKHILQNIRVAKAFSAKAFSAKAFMKTEPKKTLVNTYSGWKPSNWFTKILKCLFWPFVWAVTILWFMFKCFVIIGAVAGMALFCFYFPFGCAGILGVLAVGGGASNKRRRGRYRR